MTGGGLPAGSRYKPGRQPGSPTGKCTAAGQNTKKEKERIQSVGGDVMEQLQNLMREHLKFQF